MKTNKKLKLDTLSASELEKKEINRIKGGIVPCSCKCYCAKATEKNFSAYSAADSSWIGGK